MLMHLEARHLLSVIPRPAANARLLNPGYDCLSPVGTTRGLVGRDRLRAIYSPAWTGSTGDGTGVVVRCPQKFHGV